MRDCDSVVIGAGAGLSTSAGFIYTGERFEKYFSDFAEKYGIQDMYSGDFYPFATPEEHWAYWSRYIYINRYMDALKPVYNDLSKEMCQLLKAWRKECEWDRQQTANETVSEDDYLFRQPNGKPMNPCTFTYRFKLILKANNLPLDLNVHSLRHTNASLLIAQGVDVRTVASLLGHAQASTTLDIYAHAFDKNKRKAQEKLGKAIGL